MLPELLQIKRVIASRGFLFNDENKLLVVSKDDDRFYLPGGWCDDGEPVTVACCREIEEEAGLKTTHDKVIFVEEVVTNDTWVKNGLLHRIDFFSIVSSNNYTLDPSFVDKDDGLIKHRKFISESDWLNDNNIYAPVSLKKMKFSEIKQLLSCYNRRIGGNASHLLPLI
ncbi:MAG: NUDIX domain-containing protein [Alphaproteobacteria bacterium]|nr:NUDIX domain-containing protein [Rickettsiales bacterium]